MRTPEDREDGPASPFDPAEEDRADLWFLPDPDITAPVPSPRPLFDPDEWKQAQAGLAVELARLALRFGVLDERLRGMGEGVRQRLALRTAADLAWWGGARIDVERLTLWLGLHGVGSAEDSQALALAGWAMRRLVAGRAPSRPDWVTGLTDGLGHGRNASVAIGEVAEIMAAMPGLHPVTEAAVLFQAWRLAGPGSARDVEAAVLAAAQGASMAPHGGGAPYLPLTETALNATGPAPVRLAAWIRGAEAAVLAGLRQLDQLADWRRKAKAATSELSARTPGRLLALLTDWPMLSAPMAESQTGASRAAVQRNLDLLHERGLIREMTGQGRYRLWTARL